MEIKVSLCHGSIFFETFIPRTFTDAKLRSYSLDNGIGNSLRFWSASQQNRKAASIFEPNWNGFIALIHIKYAFRLFVISWIPYCERDGNASKEFHRTSTIHFIICTRFLANLTTVASSVINSQPMKMKEIKVFPNGTSFYLLVNKCQNNFINNEINGSEIWKNHFFPLI